MLRLGDELDRREACQLAVCGEPPRTVGTTLKFWPVSVPFRLGSGRAGLAGTGLNLDGAVCRRAGRLTVGPSDSAKTGVAIRELGLWQCGQLHWII